MILSGCSSARRRAAFGCALALSGLAVLARPHAAVAAETGDATARSRTLVLLKIDTDAPVPIQTRWVNRPPTIRIQFPPRRVLASLPERAVISAGPIQSIAAQYEGSGGKRFLRALQVQLSGPYTYQIRADAGRIAIEIEHPVSISSASIEVGLGQGTILTGSGMASISERFRAMQEALAQATPVPLRPVHPTGYGPVDLVSGEAPSWPRPNPSSAPSSSPAVPPAPRSSAARIAIIGILLLGIAAWLIGSTLVLARWRRRHAFPAGPRLPSGAVLIDQLVWRAFERQGYQLVLEQDLAKPPYGTFRIVIKDGVKSGLLFVWYGPFFEKQTVERFMTVLGEAKLVQGVLVASGSFTVPAQRMAKQHHVTLIGREQLAALLSLGAGSEYYARQLEQQQARLDEAKDTLRQYAEELDTLRTQRNEASWYLGEERAKTAKLETQIEEASQQLRRHEADLQRWEQDAAMLRKQWEESQWYLGEAQERANHLGAQLAVLQESAQRLESAERERDETSWYLGEERVRSEAMERQLAELQQQLQQAAARERALEDAIRQLRQQVTTLQAAAAKERRRSLRRARPAIHLELRGGTGTLFSGSPQDLSDEGAGLRSEQELPTGGLRARLSVSGRRPIQSNIEAVWQRSAETEAGFRSGWKFLGLSDASRKRLRDLLTASTAEAAAAASNGDEA